MWLGGGVLLWVPLPGPPLIKGTQASEAHLRAQRGELVHGVSAFPLQRGSEGPFPLGRRLQFNKTGK